MKTNIIFLLGLLSLSMLKAQVTEEDYQRAEAFISSNLSKHYYNSWVVANWGKNTSSVWYTTNSRKGTEYIKYDLVKFQRDSLFSQYQLAQQLSKKLDKEVKPYALPLKQVKYIDSLNVLQFKADTFHLKFDIKANTLSKLEEKSKGLPLSSKSPNKQHTIFVKDYNLWLSNSNGETQITKDGNKAYGYGVSPSWYSTLNIESEADHDLNTDFDWSPDGRYVIVGKYDRRQARNLYLYKTLPETGDRSEVYSYERPLAGDSITATVEYVIIDTQNNSVKQLDISPSAPFLSYGFKWTKDSKSAYHLRYKRGYQSCEILHIDPANASSKPIFNEEAATYVDPQNGDFILLDSENEFLWLSEQDNYNHIYRHSLKDGQLVKQVTKGNYVIRSIEHVDSKNKKIYFTASGKEDCDPYYPMLYVVNFNGKQLKLLTPEKAFHTVKLSPDNKFFVDNYSTIEEPNKAVLRRLSDGKALSALENGDIKDLLAMGWQKPEAFVCKGRDGVTDIYGVVFKPYNLDPNKSYPIIEGTYSGPQTIRAPKTFYRGLNNDDTPLTQLGFVLVNIDGMGSAFRSKSFHDVSYKNLGDIGGPDKILAMKALAKKYTWMDTTRVGIFGHSAGGYDAARALLAYPHWYKVGVATAGNHDHRSAKAWWPELYMGYPVKEHYNEQSNYYQAHKLEGKLLLLHGDLDQNVNPTASTRFAAELIKANKDFEIILIPNKDHGQVYYDKYLIRKRWDFFVKHLHGINPPAQYKIK
ncbi:DPP IV N-terminal domain-containing protein [Carboxylicivirga sp. N1Y90]|uniref:S9 family peptidase n=1 Tax=Carboxylicivirga fragile TaxID=3417571 RepID=UPI003D328A27|nr:DPP IV N-terminal domain-containing protein [Marinilabiliaceae bacterium N1Y90]